MNDIRIEIPIKIGLKSSCDEMFKWAKENNIKIKDDQIHMIRGYVSSGRNYPKAMVVYFDSEEEAAAFKLRWL